MAKPIFNFGFSALELVIVISIVTIISVITLANYPSFSERLAVRRAAEDIASAIRQVQAYGLGVKEFGSNQFPGYGLYFSITSINSYIFFADIVNPTLYQYDGLSEKVKDLPIEGGVQIFDLCVNQKQGFGSSCGMTSLVALYLRPNPQVSLKSGALSYSDIEIKIRGRRGTTRTIIIWQSGQVSIEEP